MTSLFAGGLFGGQCRVESSVLNSQGKAEAESKITAALAQPGPQKVQVGSALTFAAKLTDIASGSAERTEFIAGLEAALKTRLGNLKIAVTSIESGRRRLLLKSAGSTLSRRQLADAIKASFYAEAPSSVATDVASLIKTLAASSTKITVKAGNNTLSADTSTLTEPQVSAPMSTSTTTPPPPQVWPQVGVGKVSHGTLASSSLLALASVLTLLCLEC